MSIEDPKQASRKRTTWVTAVVLINVAFLAVLFLPWNRSWYVALRRRGLAGSVILAFQLWVVGSTLFATACFVWRRAKETRFSYNANPFDGMFLAAWWIALVLLCLYAGAMGAGG